MIQRLAIEPIQPDPPPSIMLKALVPGPVSTRGNGLPIDAFQLQMNHLELLPKWLVVMRTIYIHCDYKTVASTGLFGLLGDVYIDVVDVCKDSKRARALFDFAKTCEYRDLTKPLLKSQDFRWETPEMMKRVLHDLVFLKYQSHAFAAKMHPAIMFRRCPRFCNRRMDNSTSPKD